MQISAPFSILRTSSMSVSPIALKAVLVRTHHCRMKAAEAVPEPCCMKLQAQCEAVYVERVRTSEFRAEQSCAISVQFASRAPSWSGSCSLFPLAVTSSLNVNSASPAWRQCFCGSLACNRRLATSMCTRSTSACAGKRKRVHAFLAEDLSDMFLLTFSHGALSH